MEDLGMEDLRAISLRQQSASQLALLRRAPQLDEAQIVQVGELMANMMAGYPHQALEMAAEVYQLAFEDLARLYGLANLETALRGFLTREKFFPHPSEVAEVLDEMAKRTKAEALKSLPKLGCNLCHDAGWSDGWILELDEGGNRRVRKCACMVAREDAKRAMGVKSAVS